MTIAIKARLNRNAVFVTYIPKPLRVMFYVTSFHLFEVADTDVVSYGLRLEVHNDSECLP